MNSTCRDLFYFKSLSSETRGNNCSIKTALHAIKRLNILYFGSGKREKGTYQYLQNNKNEDEVNFKTHMFIRGRCCGMHKILFILLSIRIGFQQAVDHSRSHIVH
jgi:hypothetical protein